MATESRERDTARDRDWRQRSFVVDVRIWRRAVDKFVVVSCTDENNKRGPNKSGVVVITSREYVRLSC